ncbi:unnamed protein product, partial [Rotaria magnacalcarata]
MCVNAVELVAVSRGFMERGDHVCQRGGISRCFTERGDHVCQRGGISR